MRITSVRCILLSAPYAIPGDLEREFCFADGHRTISVIKVETDVGLHGLGETYARSLRSGSDARTGQAVRSRPRRARSVQDRGNLGSLGHRESLLGALRNDGGVVGGIEMALWDLKGKAEGVPVWKLLGGKAHDRIAAYASGGNNKPEPELQAEMEAFLGLGYRAVKIRINFLPTEKIVEKVAFCRKALGPDVGLAVDAVQGVSRQPWDAQHGAEIARLLEPYHLLWIEEPCGVTDYAAFAAVRRGSKTPVAGGETVTSLTEANAYLGAKALDIFQPDAGMIGGLGMFRTVAQLCEKDGVKVAVHTWAGGVGIMGNYHAAFASPNCTILELPNNPYPLREEFLIEPLVLQDGKIAAPTAPGLGVRLPPEAEKLVSLPSGILLQRPRISQTGPTFLPCLPLAPDRRRSVFAGTGPRSFCRSIRTIRSISAFCRSGT